MAADSTELNPLLPSWVEIAISVAGVGLVVLLAVLLTVLVVRARR